MCGEGSYESGLAPSTPGIHVSRADAIKHVELVKGGFSARYGGRLSSVVDITMKDLFEYRSTVDAQHLALDNPFAQPVSVYNNIQNGYGIFAGAGSTSYAIITRRPVITSISPKAVKTGDVIAITGENMDTGVSVRFNAEIGFSPYSRYVQWTDGHLEVVVPPGGVTGKIYVVASGWIVPSDEEIVILN